MHITTDVINHKCPSNIDETDCPLIKWLENNQTLFSYKWSEYLDCNGDPILNLTPTQPLFRLARTPYVNAINEINQICKNCMEKTK